MFIDTILFVYNKYHKMVCEQFHMEVGFLAALDKACATFINRNAITVKTGNANKSAEFLAACCHSLLKKSNKSMEETELDETLIQMMVVFRYIEDKDVFEGFYKKRLAERLVRNFKHRTVEHPRITISNLEYIPQYCFYTDFGVIGLRRR